jgi:hypothetical protein
MVWFARVILVLIVQLVAAVTALGCAGQCLLALLFAILLAAGLLLLSGQPPLLLQQQLCLCFARSLAL